MRTATRVGARLLGLALSLWACAAAAMPPFKMSDVDRGITVLATSVEFLEDSSGVRTLQDVAELPGGPPDGFQPATSERLSQGFSKSSFWLRLSVANDADDVRSARLALNVTWLQHVDFYLLRHRDGRAVWTHEQAGVSDPMDATHRHDRVPQLAIDLSPRESVRVLARVRSATQSKLALELHSAERWHRLERNHALLSGLLLGGLLVFCVYSIALWWISRRPVLAFQAMGLALLALYEATYSGYARIALWPGSTDWSYRAHGVTATGAVLCLMLYFHEQSRRSPVRMPGRPLLAILAAVEIIVLMGTLWGPYAAFASIGMVNAPLIVLALTVCHWRRQRLAGGGEQPAMIVMFVICAGSLLRIAALAFGPRLASGVDLYTLAVPGMLVGLFAITSWSYKEARERSAAQRALAQWQDDEQQRLEGEVRRKTHALSEALDQAERRAREQKELLAYISHDLRAPMATIIGNVRAMRSIGEHPDAQRLAAIERSATYQLDLIDDLVDFSKGDLGPLALDERPVRLRTLVDDIAQYADALAQRQHNGFELRIEGALPEAVGLDSKRVQQALLNLLSNAAKFTRDGHIGLRVRAQPAGDAWRLHFEVTDSGAGIDEEQLGRMKRALADHAPGVQGGLGLVIAQRIVQGMGGQLAIRSGAGVGTRVAFSLKARQVPPERHPPLAEPAVRVSATRRGAEVRTGALPTTAPLSPQQKKELEMLARDGRWSDLHDWVSRLGAEDQYRPLVQVIRHALDRLDFEQIRLIARAAPARMP